jgi:hypothetical protein
MYDYLKAIFLIKKFLRQHKNNLINRYLNHIRAVDSRMKKKTISRYFRTFVRYS